MKNMNVALKWLIYVVVFIAGVGLIIIGQKNIGLPGLGLMALGLAGLLALMYFYNSQYK